MVRSRVAISNERRALQEVTKEVVGLHVLLTSCLFSDDILRRFLRCVSLTNETDFCSFAILMASRNEASIWFLRAYTREEHTAEPVQVELTTYAFQILRPALLPPLLPADQARRTFNQAAKEYSENEANQLLEKPSKQVEPQP
jgi:hypothetical protein